MIAERHRWTSTARPLADSFTDWVMEARAHIGDFDLESNDRGDFHARFVQRQIGPIELTAIHASHSRAERRVSVQKQAPLRYDLKYIREGIFRIEQNGRVTEARSGQFVLVDNNSDFRFETSPMIDCICIAASEGWLRGKLPDPAAYVLQPVDDQSVWARSLGMMLSELADLPPGDHSLPAAVIAEQVAGFMVLMLEGQELHTTSYKQKLIRSLIRSIAANQHDPELSPAMIAAQHRISKRYLHALLATADTTFGRELLRARLACAQGLLQDERYRHTAVNEIAMMCGFNDPAHFARRFRSVVGHSPTEHRVSAFA